MKRLGYLLAFVGIFAAGYFIGKSVKKSTELSSPEVTGIGRGETPRFGAPKTMAERLATHQKIYGKTDLPPRGTGLTK